MTEKRFYLDVSEAYSGILKVIDFGDGTENIYPTSSRPDMEAVVELLNELNNENEQLKQKNSVFEGKDIEHYQRWINQIKKYVEKDNPDFTYNEDFIIKIALSYTLQSLRNGESLKKFQWNYKELEE